MDAQSEADDVFELDEGSWIYLSIRGTERGDRSLHGAVIEACESSGWPAVSWSPPRHAKSPADSARFFEGMSHAVEHADVVVVLLDGSTAMTDTELAFAYRYRRPVVALQIKGGDLAKSEVRAMLRCYDRAHLVDCADIDECMVALRKAFADPGFAAIIREAAGEPSTYA